MREGLGNKKTEDDISVSSAASVPAEDALDLGRKNNFRLMFGDREGKVGVIGEAMCQEVGEPWFQFVRECASLYAPAQALLVEYQELREARFPHAQMSEMVRNRDISGLQEWQKRMDVELGPLHVKVKKALEACFDELVRRGVDPELLWR